MDLLTLNAVGLFYAFLVLFIGTAFCIICLGRVADTQEREKFGSAEEQKKKNKRGTYGGHPLWFVLLVTLAYRHLVRANAVGSLTCNNTGWADSSADRNQLFIRLQCRRTISPPERREKSGEDGGWLSPPALNLPVEPF